MRKAALAILACLLCNVSVQAVVIGPTRTVVSGITVAGKTTRIDTVYTSYTSAGAVGQPPADTVVNVSRASSVLFHVGAKSQTLRANAADSGWTVTFKALMSGTFTGGKVSSASLEQGATQFADSVLINPPYSVSFDTTNTRGFYVIVRNVSYAYQVMVINKKSTQLTAYYIKTQEYREEK